MNKDWIYFLKIILFAIELIEITVYWFMKKSGVCGMEENKESFFSDSSAAQVT